METNVSVAETIRAKLTASLSPTRLDIIDESQLHAGHASAPEGGESHFRVAIVAPAFEGQSRLARQRLVYGALKDELAGPVHALAITALAPGETDPGR
jgi:BolA family transcriptional regulator, general stress-responsive regulator